MTKTVTINAGVTVVKVQATIEYHGKNDGIGSAEMSIRSKARGERWSDGIKLEASGLSVSGMLGFVKCAESILGFGLGLSETYTEMVKEAQQEQTAA